MKKHLSLFVMVGVAFGVMSGCGGGGGGGSGTVRSPETFVHINPAMRMIPEGPVQAAIDSAVRATPVPGSVTQSSNIGNNDVTTDKVEFSMDGTGDSAEYTVTNSGTSSKLNSISTQRLEDSQKLSTPLPDDVSSVVNREILMAEDVDGGLLITAVYVKEGSTDYLAGGLWAWIPHNNIFADAEIGAFADGSDPFTQGNIAGLQGTATYSGETVGLYETRGSETLIGNSAGVFMGEVTLRANFETSALGSISGDIDKITLDGSPDDLGITIPLEMATIEVQSGNSDYDGGFFDGDIGNVVISSSSTAFPSTAQITSSGKWGGQFYGNTEGDSSAYPESVAGTFAGHFDVRNGDDNADVDFIGTFVADETP